jgi:hypothetical protein
MRPAATSAATLCLHCKLVLLRTARETATQSRPDGRAGARSGAARQEQRRRPALDMLYVVGLGLGDKKDISLPTIARIASARFQVSRRKAPMPPSRRSYAASMWYGSGPTITLQASSFLGIEIRNTRMPAWTAPTAQSSTISPTPPPTTGVTARAPPKQRQLIIRRSAPAPPPPHLTTRINSTGRYLSFEDVTALTGGALAGHVLLASPPLVFQDE